MNILIMFAALTASCLIGILIAGRQRKEAEQLSTALKEKIKAIEEEKETLRRQYQYGLTQRTELLARNGKMLEQTKEALGVAEKVNKANKELFAEKEELIRENASMRKLIPKRGRWIKGHTALGTPTSTCSMCNTEITLKTGGEIKHVVMEKCFCPVCGAFNEETIDENTGSQMR